MTLGEARAKARGLLAAIADGEDPRAGQGCGPRSRAETVEAVAQRFIERHVKAHNRHLGRRTSG